MANSAVSIFKGIEQAPINQWGDYIEAGDYLLRIKSCKTGTTRKKRPYFAVDFETLESNNPNRSVGGSQTWMVMTDQDSAPSNIKAFFVSASGADPSDITMEFCDLAVSAENPLEGVVVKVEAVNKPTKSGGTFTKTIWKHVPSEVGEY